MSDYVKLLSNLKIKLEKEDMSVLIGAGFSKNVDKDIFPSWWELIFDMVKEYEEEEEVKNKFVAQSKEKEFKEYLKNKIDQHINTLGTLRVVFEYMKKKGYRESVDIKVESKTPYITTDNGKKYLN